MSADDSKRNSFTESSDSQTRQADSASGTGNLFQDEVLGHRDDLLKRLKSFEALNKRFREDIEQDRKLACSPTERMEGGKQAAPPSGIESAREITSYGDVKVALNKDSEFAEFTRWSETDTRTASLPGVDIVVKRSGQTSVEWQDESVASILQGAKPEPFVVFAYPDKSTITLDPDGTKLMALADGTTVLRDSSGITLTSFPNDLTITERSGGSRVVDLPGGGTVELPVQTVVKSNAQSDSVAIAGTVDTRLYLQLLNGLQAIGTAVVRALELPASKGNADLSELVGELKRQVSSVRDAVPPVLRAPELSLEDLLHLKKTIGAPEQASEQVDSKTISLPYGITIRIPLPGAGSGAGALPDATSRREPDEAPKVDTLKSEAGIAGSLDARTMRDLLEHPERCGYAVETDSGGRPSTIVDAQGRTINIAYDTAGSVRQISFADRTRVIVNAYGQVSIVDQPQQVASADWNQLRLRLEDKTIERGFGVGCCMNIHEPLNTATWNGNVDSLMIRPTRPIDIGLGDTSSIDSVIPRGKEPIDWTKLGKLLREKPIDNGFDCPRQGCMVDHRVPRNEWKFTVNDLKGRPQGLFDVGPRDSSSIDSIFRSELPSIKLPADSVGYSGDVGANLDRELPSKEIIPVSPVSDMAVVRTPELILERDNTGRLEQIRSGDQKIMVKYDGDKNIPSGFELRGKDGSLLASYTGQFEIDEKTGVVTVTQRDKSNEGLVRIQTRYFPNGDLERNEYNELGLRTKQFFTSSAEDGTLKMLTTNYSYLPANAASLKDINSVRSTQTDEKGRLTETAQFNSVAAVESGKPFIAEQVKYSSDGTWQRESRIVIGRSDQDQPKILAKAEKAVEVKTGATILTSEIDANGTPVKQEIRFNSDGKPTSFAKEIGKDKYSYDIDSYTGKLVGVKLDGKEISDQFRAKQLIDVGQSSVELAAIQNQVRSAVDASRQQFLNPESNASARAQALAQLKERAASGSSEERAALQKVLRSYEGIAAGLNVLSASGFELAGETAQKRIMSRPDKIAPDRLKVLADDTVKALEALAQCANSVPPNEHAKMLFESLRDLTKTPPKDAGIRLSELLTHLKSGDPKLQQFALFEIQNKLAFSTQQLMNDATRERVFAGKTSNSSLSELSKDQPDLARLARNGDKDAERMLVWMDAMKAVADGRLMTEKPVTGLELRRDSQGRPTEVIKDGFTTKLSYKEGSTEPSAVILLDRFGKKISQAEGLVRVNVRTGEVSVTQYADARPGLSKVEYVYAAGGRIDKNEYSDTGLRIKQTATIVKLDEANKSTVQTSTHTVYEYAAVGPGGRQVPTDNPLAVRVAVAVTKDSTGQPIAIRNFNNFAGVELDRPVATQLIERTARVDGKQSEVMSFVDNTNPEKPQVLGQVRRIVNHNTGERELFEESKLDKTSQAVKFDASGTVTAFTRNKGEDSYSYQLKDCKIESVVKNGQALDGAELDRLKKEGEQLLSVIANNARVKSYRSELAQVLLDGAATSENRQQALKDLEALQKRTSGADRESLNADIERFKAGNQVRTLLESVKSADKTSISENVSEKGRELVAKDSQGNEVFSIRYGKDGKPDLVREKGGNYWNSIDGGKTWTAYQDKDLKVVAKDKFGKPQTWTGEVSVVDGNLVQKWVDGSRISIRQPDGTRIWEYPKERSTGVEKVEIERPDKSTVTIKTSDSGREVVAKDARGEESYTVKFGPDGKPNFTHGKDGCEWLSSDGGKTWIAHKDRKPIENEDGTYYTWKGEVSIDSNFSLREMGKSGHLWIRSPDGSKTTRNPEDKATGSQRTDIQRPDKTSVTVTTSSNGEETVARDSKGEETYRFRTGPDGKPSYVHEIGGFHWRSSDGGKTWVAYDRAPASGTQPDTGKPVDANGRPVDDLSKAWVWKGSVSVDQNYSLLSIDNTGKVSCRRTGGLQLKWNRTDADQTELSPAEHKVVRDFKVLTELSVGPPPSQSANELLEKVGGKLAVQNLLRRLQVNEPGVREAAIKEMSAVLNPATAQAVARDQILNAVAGINKDSTAAELARIQPELLGLARAGNPQAERWLNWSEAAKNLDSLRQREPAPVAAGVRVVTDANGRPSEIRSGNVVTAKFEYSGESKVPSSIELRVPDPASPGKFKSDIIEPNGPVKVDARSGVISFSRSGSEVASLERSDTKIYPNGTVERDVYDANGLRTERRSRELGKPEAELVTSYTYIDRSGRLTENPAAVAMVMAESRNANKEVVRRENFNGFAAVELNEPALRETIETRVESNNRKVELHTYTDVSNPAAPNRVGESQRTEDAKTGEVTISGSLVSAGKPTSESAKFKANGEAVSFSRQVGDTKLDYVLKDGRVIDVKVANPEKLALDLKNPDTKNALIAEANLLLSRMREQYNIRSADNPESIKLAKKDLLDEIARNTNPASGTLVLVSKEGWEGGRYQSYKVDAGKILSTDGKQIGTLKNNGDAEFTSGRKLNVLATEGAMFSGRVGDGSNAIYFNMAKPKRDELNGVIRHTEAGSEKTYRVVSGMVFDGEKFLGHMAPSGRFHFNAADLKEPSLALLHFPNARFEGTDNSNPPHERVASLNDDAPNGKIVIPDEKGRAIEYDVRLGMIINKATGEQIGVLTPPTMHGDGSLSGGSIILMDGRTVPLGNFRGAAFGLWKPSSLARGVAEKEIEGLSLGPQERLADGSSNPEGGLYSVTQARDASELRLKQSKEKLREYDDGTHPYDYLTGVRESTVRQLKNAVRLNQRDAETFATSFHNLLNGKYSDESVDYVLATLNIARLSTGRENISIKKQQLESAPSEFESLPNDTTTINGRVLIPTITGGNVSGMQEFKIVNGELIGRDGKPIGKIENGIDPKTGQVTQGVLNMLDPRDPSNSIRGMGALTGAVWNLEMPNQYGQLQRVSWVSLGAMNDGQKSLGTGGLVSARELARQVSTEIKIAKANLEAGGKTEKSKKAFEEIERKATEFRSKLERIANGGLGSVKDLEVLLDGAKKQIRGDRADEKKDAHKLKRAELPDNMTGVEGRLRLNDQVLQIKDGKLYRAGESSPVGELKTGYQVEFANGERVDLTRQPRVLLQWKGTDGQTHNLIGLGPGAATQNFGYLAGGLVDVKQLKEQARDAISAAARQDRKYFADRPWLTGGAGNWLTETTALSWITGKPVKGGVEGVMKDFQKTLARFEKELDQQVELYFGKTTEGGSYGGSFDSKDPPDGFNKDLFSAGTYNKVGQPGNQANVGLESLDMRAGAIQTLMVTMGTTADKHAEIAQEMAGFQQQVASSLETAVVTVATAGAGTYFAAAANAGKMGRGASVMWQLGAGAGFGGLASGISMSDSSHGFGHVSSGVIKGLAMSAPGMLRTWRGVSGAAQLGEAAVKTEVVAASGLSKVLPTFAQYGGKALTTVKDNVPAMLADSAFQSTMFAAADWAKSGYDRERFLEHFDPQKLAIGTGAMFFAQVVGHGFGRATDAVGAKVGQKIAGTEAGQAFLQSRTGQVLLCAEIDQVTKRAVLAAIKQGEQSLVGSVANQMSNAYAFGFTGNLAQSIEAEKSRVAEKLGFMKRDKQGNLVPDTSMVSTDGSMFSWATVIKESHEAGLHAAADAGPMAVGTHYLTRHLTREFDRPGKGGASEESKRIGVEAEDIRVPVQADRTFEVGGQRVAIGRGQEVELLVSRTKDGEPNGKVLVGQDKAGVYLRDSGTDGVWIKREGESKGFERVGADGKPVRINPGDEVRLGGEQGELLKLHEERLWKPSRDLKNLSPAELQQLREFMELNDVKKLSGLVKKESAERFIAEFDTSFSKWKSGEFNQEHSAVEMAYKRQSELANQLQRELGVSPEQLHDDAVMNKLLRGKGPVIESLYEQHKQAAKDFEQQNNKLRECLEPRRKELQEMLDRFTTERGLPRVELSIGFETPAGLAPVYDRGRIYIRSTEIAGTKDFAALAKDIYHELTHADQHAAVIRRFLDAQSVGATVDGPRLAELKSAFCKETGLQVGEVFFNKVIEARAGKLLSAEESLRAENMLKAFQTNKPLDSNKYNDLSLKFVDVSRELAKLTDTLGEFPAQKLIADLTNNHNLVESLFGGTVPDSVRKLIADKGEWTNAREAEASMLLKNLMRERMSELNTARRGMYSSYIDQIHELESLLAERQAVLAARRLEAIREMERAEAELPQRRAASLDNPAARAPGSHDKGASVESARTVELSDRVAESVKKIVGEEAGAKVLAELANAKASNADLPIPFDKLPEMTKEQIEFLVRKVNEIEQINKKLEGKNHSDVVEGKSVADILRERALLLRDVSEPRVRVIEARQQADLVREFTDKIKSNTIKLETFERLVKQFPEGSPEREVALKLLEHSAALLSTEGLGAHMKELRRQIADDMLSEKIIPGGAKKVVTIYTLDGASEGNMLAHIFAKNNPDIRVEIFSLKGAEFSLLQQALSNKQQNVEAAQKRFDKLDAAAQLHKEKIARGEAKPDEPVLDAKGNRIAPNQAELESKLKSASDELSALSALRLDSSWSKGAQDKFKSLGGANRVRNALIFDDLSKLPAGDPRRQFLEKVPGLMIADVGGFVRGVSVTDVAVEPSATGHPAEAKVKSLVGDIQRHPAYKEYQLHLQEAVREPAKSLELKAKADAALKRAIDETLRPDESRPDGILDRNKNARKLSATDLEAGRESLLSKIGKGESERLSALHDRAAAPLLTEQGIRDYLAFVGKEVQRVNLKLIALGEPPLRHTPEEYQSAALAALRYGANIGDFATMFSQTRKAFEGIMETAGLKPDQRDKLVVIGSLESTKSDERAGSSYAMQHMLAKAGGLNEKNFVSIDDLNALVKTSEQRSLLKELQAYKVNTPEDRARLEFELREGKFAALRAKLQDSPLGRQLKDKTVVVMDDYFNSGKQQAENIADNKALLQALGVKEVVVASLGRHELPVHRDPLLTADFGTLTLRHVNAEKYPLTFKPGQHELLDHYRNLIEDMGIFSNYTDGGSDVRTAIFTPYGQPNNNARVIAALEQFMSGPRRFEGGVKLFGTEYHINGKAEGAALFEQMSQAGKVYSFTGKDGKHVEAFFVANGKLSLKQDKGGVAHGPAFLIKHEDGSFSVASGKDFLKVYAGGSDARSQRRYELLKGYYEEASRRAENQAVDQAKTPDMRRAASIDAPDVISPRIVLPDRSDVSAVARGANKDSGRVASKTGRVVHGEDVLLVKEVKSPAGGDEAGKKATVVSGDAASKRFVQVDGQEIVLERQKHDVWYFGKRPKGGGVPDSPLKVHVDAVNAEELKSLQTLLFKALEQDPALSKMVAAWKTMDPRYGQGEELAFGVKPGKKGQNAKAFTIYANSPEEARLIAKKIDDIIVNAGQRRKTGRIDHENVEEFVGLSNRVTVTREQFERSSSSSVKQSLVRLDKALQEKVCEQYGVKSPKDLSTEQLRDIENKSGVCFKLLEVDKDGQLALRVTGNPKDPTKERVIGKDKLYVAEGIDGEYGKTDRKALFALSARFGVDPLKVADSAVRSVESDKAVIGPERSITDREKVLELLRQRRTAASGERSDESHAQPDKRFDAIASGSRDGKSYRLILKNGSEAKEKITFSTRDELVNAPIEELRIVCKNNLDALAAVVASSGKELPFIGLRGASEERTRELIDKRLSLSRSGDPAGIYIAVYKSVADNPATVVSDLCHAARQAISYTKDHLSKSPSTDGSLTVFDMTSKALNGKLIAKLSESPLVNEALPRPENNAEAGVAITPENFDKLVKGVISKEVFKSLEVAEGSVSGERAELAEAIKLQAVVLEALKLAGVVRTEDLPVVFKQPKGRLGERDAVRAAESEPASSQGRAVERRAKPESVADGDSVSKISARPKEFDLAKSSDADREVLAKEGRISKFATKESIKSVARSMVEIADGWVVDLSLQEAKKDDAYKAYRSASAEYQSRVIGNLENILSRRELESTDAVRKCLVKMGDQEGLEILERYAKARETNARESISFASQLNPRITEVNNYINQLLQSKGLPSVEIVLCSRSEMSGNLGQYQDGKLYLLRSDLLNHKKIERLVNVVLHEAGHVDHERQVVALIADELKIGKKATPEQLNKLRELYLTRGGFEIRAHSDGPPLSIAHAEKILDSRNGVTLTGAEKQRAEIISLDWFKWSRDLESPFRESRNSQRVLNTVVDRLREPGRVGSARDLIEQLAEPTGHTLAKRLFGRALSDADFPGEVTSLIKMYKSWKSSGKPNWNEDAAKSLLEDTLTSRQNELNKKVASMHSDYLALTYEVESHVLGNEAAEHVRAILQRRGIVSTGNDYATEFELRPNSSDAGGEKIGRPAVPEPFKPFATFGADRAGIAMSSSVDFLVGNVVVNVLPGQEQVLGRSHQRDLPLQVSRTHAFVGRDSEGTYIREDSGKPSSQGTFILMGGKGEAIRLPVSEPGKPDFKFRLQPGDVVILGGEDGVRFEIPAGDQVAPRVEVGKYRQAQEHSPASALVSEALLSGGKVRILGEWSGGNSAHEKYTAKVTGGDGQSVIAIFRPTDSNEQAAERFRKENAAQHLNRLIGLDNGYPASVEQVVEVDGRARRGWLQDSTGRTLEDPGFATGALRELAVKRYGQPSDVEKVSRLIREDAHLRDQFEQAALERMILGDDDDNGLNRKIVVGKDGKIRIQNFDLDFGFQLDPTPVWGSGQHTDGVQRRLIKDFAEQPISAKNLDRLRVFLERFDTDSGRKELLNTGLKQQEVIAVLARARWFLTEGQGKFPRRMSMMEMLERAMRMKK